MSTSSAAPLDNAQPRCPVVVWCRLGQVAHRDPLKFKGWSNRFRKPAPFVVILVLWVAREAWRGCRCLRAKAEMPTVGNSVDQVFGLSRSRCGTHYDGDDEKLQFILPNLNHRYHRAVLSCGSTPLFPLFCSWWQRIMFGSGIWLRSRLREIIVLDPATGYPALPGSILSNLNTRGGSKFTEQLCATSKKQVPLRSAQPRNQPASGVGWGITQAAAQFWLLGWLALTPHFAADPAQQADTDHRCRDRDHGERTELFVNGYLLRTALIGGGPATACPVPPDAIHAAPDPTDVHTFTHTHTHTYT